MGKWAPSGSGLAGNRNCCRSSPSFLSRKNMQLEKRGFEAVRQDDFCCAKRSEAQPSPPASLQESLQGRGWSPASPAFGRAQPRSEAKRSPPPSSFLLDFKTLLGRVSHRERSFQKRRGFHTEEAGFPHRRGGVSTQNHTEEAGFPHRTTQKRRGFHNQKQRYGASKATKSYALEQESA